MVKKIRILSIIMLLAVVSVLFVGCEKTQIEKAQDKIVSIGEQFLDYEITADEAIEQLDSIAIPSTGDSLGLQVDKDYLGYLILKTQTNRATFEEIDEKIKYINKANYNK